MQLAAEQTSLEPLPHRVGPDGRRPFKSQSARGDGSRFTSDTIWAQRSRVPDPQAPKVDLNKLPIRSRWLRHCCMAAPHRNIPGDVPAANGDQCGPRAGIARLTRPLVVRPPGEHP